MTRDDRRIVSMLSAIIWTRSTRPNILLERVYPDPPEKVWRAVTDRDALAAWFMPNDFAAQTDNCRFTVLGSRFLVLS
jgi:uncharacterized protein YndB with AHSA1/START domain